MKSEVVDGKNTDETKKATSMSPTLSSPGKPKALKLAHKRI